MKWVVSFSILRPFGPSRALISTQVADDAVEAALLLRSLSGRIRDLGAVVAVGAAGELVEDIIKTGR